MKISNIVITHHRLPMDPPFCPSWDVKPRHHFDATITRVETDEGLVGVASGDSMVGLKGYEEMFIGRDPLEIERHYRYLDNINFHFGRCWPLDLALWDLAGKILNQPVWRLLGGLNSRIRAYASSAVLRDPKGMADVAQRFVERGFKAMKVRFHRGDWRDDIRALEAVRAAVGSKLELMVDCNQGWRMAWDTATPWSIKDAVRVARVLEQLDVYWMEEPLHRGDHTGMAQLRNMTNVRIAGGEMTRELYEFRMMMERGCLDVYQPDAALVGGITGLRRIALMAQEHNVVFTPHTWSNGMGLVANAHLTVGLTDAPFLEFPFDPPDWSLDRRDYMMAQPFDLNRDGWLQLSEAPGLGYVLNEELLARTRIG